jgi:LytS/YehU family sensor histidine kinase
VGLANTRERLEKRFRADHAFSIARREPAGTRVRIRIPWCTAPAQEEARAVLA